MSQNEKGPATAPTVPSHGSTNPTKDMEMNEKEHSTGSAATPARKPTAEQIADALLDLETPLCDLVLMAKMTVDVTSSALGRRRADGNVIRLSKEDREIMLFAVFDLSQRAEKLREIFYAGAETRRAPQ